MLCTPDELTLWDVRCFDAPNIPAAIFAICEKEPAPITGYSAEAIALVAALLCKEPAGRPDITAVVTITPY